MNIQNSDWRISVENAKNVLKRELLPRHYVCGLDLPEKLFANARLLPNRSSVLKYLPKGGVVAEVGVAYGDFSEQILDVLNPDKFYAIDYYGMEAGKEIWGRKLLLDSKMTHQEYFEHRVKKQINKGLVEVIQGLSWEMLDSFADNTFDYIYLDADHNYPSVVKDIGVISRVIKNGGIIQFNDYTTFDPVGLYCFGVKKAVDEFLINSNHEILYYCLEKDSFNDIVVKVCKAP